MSRPFIVKHAGQLMGYGFRNNFGLKKGVLVPVAEPFLFGSEQAANKAVARTIRTSEMLKRTILDGWEKLKPLQEPGTWTVEQVPKKKRGPRPKPEAATGPINP